MSKDMEIRWFGQSCFEIKSETGVVITDPYNDEIGFVLPKLLADVLTISHDHFDHNAKAKVNAQKIITTPGEYEVGEIKIFGILSDHDNNAGADRGKNVIFRFLIDEISILHLGDFGADKLTDIQLNEIGTVDILLIPVGGKYTIDVPETVAIVKAIEPKIIIPMHYKIPGLDIDISSVDEFVAMIGLRPERMDTLKISAKTLPMEKSRLIVLNKT